MVRILENKSSKLWMLASGALLLCTVAMPHNAYSASDWVKIEKTDETIKSPSDTTALLTRQLAECQSSECKERVKTAIAANADVDTAIAEESGAAENNQEQMIGTRINHSFADMPAEEADDSSTEAAIPEAAQAVTEPAKPVKVEKTHVATAKIKKKTKTVAVKTREKAAVAKKRNGTRKQTASTKRKSQYSLSRKQTPGIKNFFKNNNGSKSETKSKSIDSAITGRESNCDSSGSHSGY